MTYDETGGLQLLGPPQTGRLQHTIAAHRTAVNFATYAERAHIVTASADGIGSHLQPKRRPATGSARRAHGGP